MAQGFKSNISFTKRCVLVSNVGTGRASTVSPSIRTRLHLAEPKVIEVIEPKPGETRVEFIQRVEEVADLILLVDDQLCEKLIRTPYEAKPAELAEGQELVVALLQNEIAARQGMQQRIRIWLAMVDALKLEALSVVASGRWDLTCDELRGRLHWLYKPDERVKEQPADNGILCEDDDLRLLERITRFRDHARAPCAPCSQDTPTNAGLRAYPRFRRTLAFLRDRTWLALINDISSATARAAISKNASRKSNPGRE